MLRITLILLSLLISVQFILNQQIPISILYFYIVINLITLVMYAFDKSAARNARWRIKESQLHLLSLLGGWWGALIAQHFIRHKSVKKSFLIVFIVTILINICLLSTVIYQGIL